MQNLLKTVERIAVAVGIGFTFFAVLEAIQAYQTLAQMHPWAGYGFLAVLALLFFYLIWQLRALATYRTALAPPSLPEGLPATRKQAEHALRYLNRVTVRFEENPLLSSSAATQLTALRTQVDILQSQKPQPEWLREELQRVENEAIAPLLKHLDKEAEKVVSDNVGLVTIGTALSPYRSIDLYIVLARNFRMVNRIIHIYRTRPSTRETVRVFYDIAKVVAAVNLLNAMDNIWAGVARHVPKVGTLAEAFSEGLFSGLLTSVAGHAAIDRSRSYRPWSGEDAVRRYRGRLHRWARDVVGILIRHGFDRIIPGRGKREAAASEGEDTPLDDASPNLWSKLGFGRKR